jgi:hypothetical protein
MNITYRKLPGLVEAQQVPDVQGTATVAELAEVALWAGGQVQTFIDTDRQAASLIRIPTLEGALLAFASDFIVKDGDSITAVSADAFAAQYVAAE